MKYIHEREIWLVDLGFTKGIEIQKVRPCLIIRVFNQRHVVVVPLTSQKKIEKQFYCLENISFLDKKSWVCCKQIRAIDRSRCKRLLGKIPDSEFYNAKKILGEVLKLPPQGPNGQKSKENSLPDQNDLSSSTIEGGS